MKTNPRSLWRRPKNPNPHSFKRLAAILLCACLANQALAQQLSAATSASQLQAAVALFDAGEVRMAQTRFAEIATSDPGCEIALAYDALCRYEVCRADPTNGYGWFLQAFRSPSLKQAVLPPEIREDLAYKQIAASYQETQVDPQESVALISRFKKDYPNSQHQVALAEYELAAWFETGAQTLFAASLGEHKPFYRAWTNGTAYLGQFLSRAKTFPTNNYVVLEDRSLEEDLRVALVLIGKEPMDVSEISVRSALSRERYGLLRLGLHQKLHPEAWEKNLLMLAECRATLQAMSPTRDRARLTRHLTAFAFRVGGRLCGEAAGLPPEQPQAISNRRAVAARYFADARALHRQFVGEKWFRSRTSPTDMALLWIGLFNSYHCERSYNTLMTETAIQLTNAIPGSPSWLAAKLYQGVALAQQEPPQPEAAAKALDQLLSYGFKGMQKNSIHDPLIFSGLRWRLHLAVVAGDTDAALKLLQWAETGAGAPDVKRKFLKDHAWVARWAQAKQS